ncbi:uncharacterized protein K02A2.6-like [Anopheles moucheti]|uniref:uncharacterized protein K02A2.6-like n=1 Tax=Anopheles moucheti TaxID=186751 RepID=UPI0022F0F976|nr:uncharacterized protein K02A2.6-like [Anopheles moucheti]
MRKLRYPLDKLLLTGSAFQWTTECQKVFEQFKDLLSTELLLTHYDPKRDIVVSADASSVGLGATLCHKYPDGSMNVVQHASRALSKAEFGYSQIDREGLAIVFAVTKFHRMIYGRHFTLQTDHRPLVRIFGSKKGIPTYTANRLQRFALTLQLYDMDIEYVPTGSFGNADVLSRLIQHHAKPEAEYVIAWRRVHIDYAGPFEGFYFLVVVDAFSKWSVVYKSPGTTTSATIAMLRNIFARFGMPETLVSDNGPQFTSSLFAEFCNSNGIEHITTAPFHPQSNGQAERFVDTLKRALRKIQSDETSLDEALELFLISYRSTPNAQLSQQKTPAEEMFGRPIRTALELLRPPSSHSLSSSSSILVRSFQPGEPVSTKSFHGNSWK